MPAGLGDPMFDGLENRLAAALFGIPAVRGVEFGEGFRAADMRGSEHNDAFTVEDGRIVTKTNRHAGALGGITTGMPVVCRVAFKPTPSIAIEQKSVDLQTRKEIPLVVGRPARSLHRPPGGERCRGRNGAGTGRYDFGRSDVTWN